MIATPDSALVARLHPSPNIEPRRAGFSPTILLMHYTGLDDVDRAIDWLSRPESKVSCHYVIAADGVITQMVAEEMRAWHAGLSCWQGETDINSASIGIEIDNPGHEAGSPAFPPAQMQAVAALSREIIARHAIPPERVLAHSDVAPQRKIDPGETFDWRWLAAEGIGHWVEPVAVGAGDEAGAREEAALGAAGIARFLTLLAGYGYDIAPDRPLDLNSRKVVKAFQRHFRPARVDGIVDGSSVATLQRLCAALATEPPA